MEQKTSQIPEKEKYEDRLVRILSKDIEGKNTVYHGLTMVKGISWSMSNAICKALKLDKKKKIGSLTIDEIKNITDFMAGGKPKLPVYLLNRKRDLENREKKNLFW